jgi:hypothetical protein
LLGFELAADVGHVDAEVVGLVAVLRSPHVLEDLALRDELVAVADEDLDDAPLGRGEPDLLAVAMPGRPRSSTTAPGWCAAARVSASSPVAAASGR